MNCSKEEDKKRREEGDAGTCGVAEDGDGAGGEGGAAEAEGGVEGGPEGEGVRDSECVVLVEDDATEAEAVEGGPVDPTDVGNRKMWEGEAGLRRRHAQDGRRPLPVEQLPQRSLPLPIAAAIATNAHSHAILLVVLDSSPPPPPFLCQGKAAGGGGRVDWVCGTVGEGK